MHSAVAFTLALLVLSAGCLGSPDTSPPGGLASGPGAESGLPDLERLYHGTECQAGAAIVVVPFDRTGPWLPPGFHAADLSTLIPMPGTSGDPLPVTVGRTGIALATFGCANADLDGASLHLGLLLVLVEPPVIDIELQEANIHLYAIETVTSSRTFARLLEPYGWHATLADISFPITQDLGLAGDAVQAQAQDENGTMLFEVTAVGAQFYDIALGRVRIWHTNAVGTGVLDLLISSRVSGGAARCSLQEGSIFQEVIASTSCPPTPGSLFSQPQPEMTLGASLVDYQYSGRIGFNVGRFAQ